MKRGTKNYFPYEYFTVWKLAINCAISLNINELS